MLGRRVRLRVIVAGFLLPAVFVYLAFYVGPILFGLGLSLYNWDGLSQPLFVGLDNFITLLQDSEFWGSVGVNLAVVVVSILTQLPLALLLAALLMGKGRAMRFFRTVLFLPQVLSLVAVGMLWRQIYNPNGGLANALLARLDLGPVDWLGSPTTALPCLLFVACWFYFGFHMILQMAGMSAIPHEIYEAAALETSSRARVFVWVTLPLLRETLLLSTVMIVTGSFAVLIGLFWVMTEGGPAHATELLSIYMYVTAFKSYQIGYANALLVVMLIFLALVIGALVWYASRERIEY